jgi:hypothetical protein
MNDQVLSGQITPCWDMDEVRGLDYFYEPFNDPQSVELWKKIYNSEFSIGMQADFRSRQPLCQEQIFTDIQSQELDISNQGFSWYRMLPGDIIPEHGDTYASYCRYHNVPKHQAVRILVLLEDWRPGYLLEVAGKSYSHYPAGTWVLWHADTPHMAGNLSHVPRYTLQITATKK